MNSRIATLLLAVWGFGLGACSPSKEAPRPTALTVDSGIIGGVSVDAKDEIAPSTVAIGSDTLGVFCSGVLVAKNLVLTAGHCSAVTAQPDDMLIFFGQDLNKAIKLRVQGGKVPEQWPLTDIASGENKNWPDMALLRFEGEAPEGFVPVRLLSSLEPLKKGMDVILAGYGYTGMHPIRETTKLLKVTVPLSDPDYSPIELKFAPTSDGKSACHGDSGGPAFAHINNKLFLIGVTSRSATSDGADNCSEGSIYTSVPGEIEFLKQAARYLNSSQFVPNEPIPRPRGL